MAWHPSPETTVCHFVQLAAAPGWVGAGGVATVDEVVVVAVAVAVAVVDGTVEVVTLC
jgi:hypothetical protein